MQYRISKNTDNLEVLLIKIELIVFIELKMKYITETVNSHKNAINKADYKRPIKQLDTSLANSIDHIEILNRSSNEQINSNAVYLSNPRSSSHASHNSLSVSSINKIRIKAVKKDPKFSDLMLEDERQRRILLKKMKKHDLQKLHAAAHHQNHHSKQQYIKQSNTKRNFEDEYKVAKCRLTFIFDPNGRLSYWMGKTLIFNLIVKNMIYIIKYEVYFKKIITSKLKQKYSHQKSKNFTFLPNLKL